MLKTDSVFRYMSGIVLDFPDDANEVEKENPIIASQTTPSIVFVEHETPSPCGNMPKFDAVHREFYSHPRRRKRERRMKCEQNVLVLIYSS